MKKLIIGLAMLALLALTLCFVGPPLIEARVNAVRRNAATVSDRARQLHRGLLVADLHADTLLWQRDLLQQHREGHVDVPRLIKGNVALQAFTVVTKAPRGLNMVRNDDTSDLVLPLVVAQRWPPATWSSLKERALYQARRFQRASSASNGRLVPILNRGDLNAYIGRRLREPGITAGFLGLEGAHALDDDLSNLDELFRAGFRMISPTHFTDNSFAGSATGSTRGGLTPDGRRLVRAMEERRMIIDLAHTSPRTIDDVLAVATRPVLVSHTGVAATCKSDRNLTDEQVRRIAASGGVIGIAYFRAATCGTDATAIVKAMRHVRDLVGVEHVALGSDFDGAVAMPFDTTDLVLITEALLTHGFTESEIAKIMGGNVLRFLKDNLP